MTLAAVVQHLQVLEERRERHVEGLGQLGHRRCATAQALEDRPSGRVCQCLKHAVELDGLVRHKPKYEAAGYIGQHLSIDEDLRTVRGRFAPAGASF